MLAVSWSRGRYDSCVLHLDGVMVGTSHTLLQKDVCGNTCIYQCTVAFRSACIANLCVQECISLPDGC